MPPGPVAVASIRPAASALANANDTPVFIQDLSFDRNATAEPLWKAVLLGSAIATLFVVGGVYAREHT